MDRTRVGYAGALNLPAIASMLNMHFKELRSLTIVTTSEHDFLHPDRCPRVLQALIGLKHLKNIQLLSNDMVQRRADYIALLRLKSWDQWSWQEHLGFVAFFCEAVRLNPARVAAMGYMLSYDAEEDLWGRLRTYSRVLFRRSQIAVKRARGFCAWAEKTSGKVDRMKKEGCEDDSWRLDGVNIVRSSPRTRRR